MSDIQVPRTSPAISDIDKSDDEAEEPVYETDDEEVDFDPEAELVKADRPTLTDPDVREYLVQYSDGTTRWETDEYLNHEVIGYYETSKQLVQPFQDKLSGFDLFQRAKIERQVQEEQASQNLIVVEDEIESVASDDDDELTKPATQADVSIFNPS
jgi:hypothetical protein